MRKLENIIKYTIQSYYNNKKASRLAGLDSCKKKISESSQYLTLLFLSMKLFILKEIRE